jgi:hypothetical protein
MWGDPVDTADLLDDIDASCGGSVAAPVDVDLVIAADVAACVYGEALEALVVSLEQLCRSRSRGRDGIALVAYKRRHFSEDAFFDAARSRFQVNVVSRELIHEDFRSDATMCILELVPLPSQ